MRVKLLVQKSLLFFLSVLFIHSHVPFKYKRKGISQFLLYQNRFKKKKQLCQCILSNSQLLNTFTLGTRIFFSDNSGVHSVQNFSFNCLQGPPHCALATVAPLLSLKGSWDILVSGSLHLLFSLVTLFQQKSSWLIPPHSSGIFTNVTVDIGASSTSQLKMLASPRTPYLFSLL